MGSRSPLGRWWTEWTGHSLAFTFEGLVIASVLYSLPFAVQPIAAAFCADRSEPARSVGHARRVAVPHVRARHAAAVHRGRHRRPRPELRAHGRRVRRRADGRRQPAGRHAHGLDLDLRPRAGARVSAGQPDGARCCWRSRSSSCWPSTDCGGGRGRRRRSHDARVRHHEAARAAVRAATSRSRRPPASRFSSAPRAPERRRCCAASPA